MIIEYRNKKNGKKYKVIAIALDKTSGQAARDMFVYHPEIQPNEIYVREINDFKQKFEEIRISV